MLFGRSEIALLHQKMIRPEVFHPLPSVQLLTVRPSGMRAKALSLVTSVASMASARAAIMRSRGEIVKELSMLSVAEVEKRGKRQKGRK